ncbi:MAG: RluA family pseudouridine synthase [Patescibacteria group bacterium]|jgi:23S rRNA pseudouridine1911/1915/1917 synthase|nr:RluA family pseudouridine synthase [Patescibacteria group bacterium]
MGAPIKIINESEFNIRADVLLANHYPKYSRAALAKLFNMQKISMDGKPIKAGERIRPNISIDADISDLTKPVDGIELPIIYEDENVIVINKPAGVISHARGKYWDEPSVASFVRSRVSDMFGERAGIVHRLDRATSGVMICAKNPQTLSFLQKQFSDRKVTKTYIAQTEKAPNPESGIIDIPLARNPNKPQTFMVSPNGKSSQTEYHTIEQSADRATIKLHPLTGRSHQLRVHLKHLGRPIIGDDLYRGKPADRLYLHAESLEITLPGGKKEVFNAPLPKEMK